MFFKKNILAILRNYSKAYLQYKNDLHGYGKSLNKHNNKSIVIKMTHSHIYSRFFYTLIKFFSLAGYDIYFPNFDFWYYKKHFYNTSTSNYYSLLFKEQLLIFKNPPKNNNVVFTINDNSFSPDYFTPLLLKKTDFKSVLFIPMPMHPRFYSKGLWDLKISLNVKRKRAIFMAGNFDKKAYLSLNDTPFKMESRVQVYHYLENLGLITDINSITELDSYIKSDNEFSCIIMDTKKAPIPMQHLRETINSFHFFFALPGVHKPLCHNLTEAFSVGAIPIIHETYANLIMPKLEHMKTAIIYKDLKDLESIIHLAYSLNDNQIALLRNNINTYYKTHLTPNAIVEKIITKKHDVMYLQTVQICVKLLSQFTSDTSSQPFISN